MSVYFALREVLMMSYFTLEIAAVNITQNVNPCANPTNDTPFWYPNAASIRSSESNVSSEENVKNSSAVVR